MICAECSKVIDGDERIEGQHPVAHYMYACHRACWTGRFSWSLCGRADAR
jgi:hypothetical protein